MKYSYVFVCLPQIGNLLLLVLRDPAVSGAQGAQEEIAQCFISALDKPRLLFFPSSDSLICLFV